MLATMEGCRLGEVVQVGETFEFSEVGEVGDVGQFGVVSDHVRLAWLARQSRLTIWQG